MMSSAWLPWTLAGVLTAAILGVVVIYMHRGSAPYREEEARWEPLRSQGVQAEAVVVALKRGLVGRAYDMGMDLTVRFADQAGSPRQALVRAYLAEDLIANFAPGKHIHILFDPADPSIAAIDRRRTPTVIR